MQQIVDGVWRLEGPAFPMPLGAKMPVGSTVVRLADSALALYSPVAFDDAQTAAIDALGDVAHVISPNLFHHAYIAAALARWPRATYRASPGLATKRPDLPAPQPVADLPGVQVVHVAGMPKFDEYVLFHAASATLVCGDLVFNIPRPPELMSRVMFGMTGIGGGKPAQSRLWRMLTKDREANRASIDEVLALPFQRIVPAHGAALDLDAAGLAALFNLGGTARRAGS